MNASVLLTAWTLSLALAEPGFASRVDRNPGHLKMGLVNLKTLYSDSTNAETNKANIQENLKRHLYFIDRLAAEGVEFVGFPELSINGYHFSKNMTWLRLDGPEIKTLKQKAIEKGVYISAGLANEDSDGKRWNLQIVIGPKGQIVGQHRKIWLTKEKGFTEAGTEHKVFEVKGLKMGISHLRRRHGSEEPPGAGGQRCPDHLRTPRQHHRRDHRRMVQVPLRLGWSGRLDCPAESSRGPAQPRRAIQCRVQPAEGHECEHGMGQRCLVHRPGRQDPGANAVVHGQERQQRVCPHLQHPDSSPLKGIPRASTFAQRLSSHCPGHDSEFPGERSRLVWR